MSYRIRPEISKLYWQHVDKVSGAVALGLFGFWVNWMYEDEVKQRLYQHDMDIRVSMHEALKNSDCTPMDVKKVVESRLFRDWKA